jgi:hypothetical protein
MSRELAYSRSVRPEFRTYLANGLASWLAPRLSINRRFPLTSLPSVDVLSADERSRVPNTNGRGWLSCSTNLPRDPTSQLGESWSCMPAPFASGGTVGRAAISRWWSKKVAAASPFFPPRDQAVVNAVACEAACQTKLPLSRLSTSDLAARAATALRRSISPSTVWCILDADAIKPWRYEDWIFPRDPQFAEKAGRVLDLYAGLWEGKPLGRRDYIISSDEKSVRMRKPASRPGSAATRYCRQPRGVLCASRANTNEVGLRSIWLPGMSDVGESGAGARLSRDRVV